MSSFPELNTFEVLEAVGNSATNKLSWSGPLQVYKSWRSGARRGKPATVRTSRPTLELLEDRTLLSSAPITTLPHSSASFPTAVNQSLPAAGFGRLTAPTLKAQVVSSTQVNLSWTNVAGASGYMVDQWTGSSWKQIASLGSGATTFSVTGLSPGTSYYLDVGAYNWMGTAWANYQHVTTQEAAGLPAAPTFTARATSGTQISLTWSSASGATGYLVNEWVGGNWKQIASLGSGTTSYTVAGLSPNTSYSLQVGAFNSLGTTWANSQSVTTSAAVTQTFVHPAAAVAYKQTNGSLFGANGPSYLDVQQGSVGDCWLLASFAAVAARAPSIIRSMFTFTGTAVENSVTVGVYTVRLYDTRGTAHSITVDTMLPGGGSYYEHANRGVLWVGLAEKAYAQANAQGWVVTQYPRVNSYNALNGGLPSWALSAITGKSARDFDIDPANIAAALAAGKFVVLGSSSHPVNPNIVGGFDGTHAYAVVGYNPASASPFRIYNPWGTDSSGWALGRYHGRKVFGLVSVTAAFLAQNFSDHFVGTKEASDAITRATASATVPPEDVKNDISFTRNAGAAEQAIFHVLRAIMLAGNDSSTMVADHEPTHSAGHNSAQNHFGRTQPIFDIEQIAAELAGRS